MKKPTLIALMIVLGVGIYMGPAQADSCDAVVVVGPAVTGPCPNRVAVPVYLSNPCPVGGLNIQVSVTDPSWAAFDTLDLVSADRTGGRITDWESFGFTIEGSESHFRIHIVALADMPGGDSGVYLPPGDGLIFTVYPHIKSTSYGFPDSCQLMNFGTVQISSQDGYSLWGRTLIRNDLCLTGTPTRGDVNDNGTFNGLDVTCLVNYLKGSSMVCFCGGLCGGDSNNSGNVNGLDVTYMVNYLKGIGPALVPCD